MISVKVTFEDLEKAGACAIGIERFAKWVHFQGRKKSFYVKEWTPLHSVWASLNLDFVWLREKGLIPLPYLRGAYLRGANLYGANLYGAYADSAPADWVLEDRKSVV